MESRLSIPWWRSRIGIALIGTGLVVAFYVLREHWGHALGIAPYLLLLACPLMHFLMPHHHGGYGPAPPKEGGR